MFPMISFYLETSITKQLKVSHASGGIDARHLIRSIIKQIEYLNLGPDLNKENIRMNVPY